MTLRNDVAETLEALLPGVTVYPEDKQVTPTGKTLILWRSAVQPGPNNRILDNDFTVIVLTPVQFNQDGIDELLDDVIMAVRESPALVLVRAVYETYAGSLPCFNVTLRVTSQSKD